MLLLRLLKTVTAAIGPAGSLAVGLAATGAVTTVQAGTFYTDQASFDAAVAGLLSEWSEDFEGATAGALPAAPISIGSGHAEIFTDGPQSIISQTATGNLAYWNEEFGGAPTTIIRGLGSSSLSVNAVSFNYNMGGVGDNTYVASFETSAGLANTFLAETPVSYPNGELWQGVLQDVPLFLGWVGGTGESLDSVSLAPPSTGIVVDKFRAYVVPQPEVDLSVNIDESADPVQAGSGVGNLTYTVMVTNDGPDDATGIEVSRVLTLPAGVSVDSTTPGAGSFAGTTWSLGNLASGASETLTVALTADATAAPGADVISLTAEVTAVNEPDPDSSNDSASEATSVVSQGAITIVKVTAPDVAGDGTFTFSSDDDLELDVLSLTTAGNIAMSAAFTRTAGSFTVTEDEAEGWRLSDISCTGDANGGPIYDVEARSVTIDLDGSEAITCTFTNVRDEDYVRTRSRRVVANFLSRRVDVITASELELASRLTRRGSMNGSGGVLGFMATGTLSDYEVSYSTSLSRIANAHEAAKVIASGGIAAASAASDAAADPVMAYNGSAPNGVANGVVLPGEPRRGFDVWIEGKWVHVDDETRESDIGLLYVGADYLINPSLLIGVLAQFDWMDEADKTEGVSADGHGWMAGPYVVARLHQNLLFDGRVAWGQSNNNVNPLGLYTDSFDTDRWLARGQLTGDFRHGNWLFSPHARVVYFEEDQKAYTDSLGIMIPGQTVSLGRVTFGPKISYAYLGEDGLIVEPHIGVEGIWDFDKAEIVDLTTGVPVGTSDDIRARAEGGLSVRLANGWSLLGEGFYDGIGIDDLDIYGGRVRMTVPLH